MTQLEHQTALIVGVGQGLSAALARLFSTQGFRIALASRDTAKLESLCKETGAIAIDCDVADANQVAQPSGDDRTGHAGDSEAVERFPVLFKGRVISSWLRGFMSVPRAAR